MSRFKSKIRRYLDGAYKIGIVEDCDFDNTEGYFSRIHWINTVGYHDGWFADPFIIKLDLTTITLFVEEYQLNCKKGRISEITVNRNDYRLMEVKSILELDSHLSFPYPIVYQGNIYVCPENCEANEIAIYRYDGNQLIDKVKILSGTFVDTQIIYYNGYFLLFTSKLNLNLNGGARAVEIYCSKELFGPYSHIQTIDNSKAEERGAGLIFNSDNRLIRPTQNCVNSYGNGVIFNLLDIKNNKIEQSEICRINSDSKFKNGLCFHTYSVFENLTAVDGFDYPVRLIGKATPYIYGIKRFLNKYI